MDFMEENHLMKHAKNFLLLILLFGSQMFARESSPYISYADQIVKIFTKEMENEYGLICIGGGGSMNVDVAEMEVVFVAYRHLNIDEAREIEVKATERLLYLINSNEKIRPYLREYPFPVNRAMISISLRTAEDNRPTDGSVALVSTGRNKIFYSRAELQIWKSQPPIYGSDEPLPFKYVENETEEEVLITLKEEPYEEALRIVQKGPSCLDKKDVRNVGTRQSQSKSGGHVGKAADNSFLSPDNEKNLIDQLRKLKDTYGFYGVPPDNEKP